MLVAYRKSVRSCVRFSSECSDYVKMWFWLFYGSSLNECCVCVCVCEEMIGAFVLILSDNVSGYRKCVVFLLNRSKRSMCFFIS